MCKVMGIVNVTPDSFSDGGKFNTPEEAIRRAKNLVEEGAAIIDVGAYSTRPGASTVSEEEEQRRLTAALSVIRRDHPHAIVSIDTFRSQVARRCVEDFGADIINDISGGLQDEAMFPTVADLRVPYVLTHNTPIDAASLGDDALAAAVAREWATNLQRLYDLGVSDVILDPGFGFSKTLEQNYVLMRRLPDLVRTFPDNAVLVGVSRKSMIWRLLNTSPEEALTGTTVLHTVALEAGARLLRVHDVRAAVEAIRVWQSVHS